MFRAIFSLIIRSILTVFTASGFIHVRRFQLLSWLSHDIFAHHQEHLNRIYNFWFYSRVSSAAADDTRE
jgi:hypothetical protein